MTGCVLEVIEKPGALVLKIVAPPDSSHDWSRYEAFPLTPQVLDPAAGIRFSRTAPLMDRRGFEKPIRADPGEQLTLILARKDDGDSFELSWSAP